MNDQKKLNDLTEELDDIKKLLSLIADKMS